MQYINITPNEYVERPYCERIFSHLKDKFDNDTFLCVRNWETECDFDNRKRIVIVTSAEGHKYTPKDMLDKNCLGVFMHYYPKTHIQFQYDDENFARTPQLFELPLGTTKFFKSPNVNKPISERKYSFCFVGQLDPYRRREFYECVMGAIKNTEYNPFVKFYSGWNKGYSGEQYSEILSDSIIALVPWGSASLDTFRFYEAMESGCIVLSDKQNQYEFMKKSPHIEISWNNLQNELAHVLSKSEDELQKISMNTKEFFDNCLSPSACANFVCKKIGTII